MNLLQVESLTKSFGKSKGIFNIDMSITKGKVLALMGSNGAGKSTLIKSLLARLKYDSGNITWFNNQSFDKNRESILQKIGYVSDEPILFETETISSMVNWVSKFYINWDIDYQKWLMDKFQLDPSDKIATLSRGMKRKLSLLLALSYRPQFLVLDEASSGLDPETRDDLMEILVDFVSEQNNGVLYVTHYLEEVEKIATDLLILNHGKISEQINLSTLDQFRNLNKQELNQNNIDPKSIKYFDEKTDSYLVQNNPSLQMSNDLFIQLGESTDLRDLYNCVRIS
ncbi:MAG: sodium ABC transporter ATP-binding protein [Candidatus Cloacimonadota bacterium]|nr:MAG: sodium ABC transporter ATP-binding protein [Candidatus Cloacimonadota bacterium]